MTFQGISEALVSAAKEEELGVTYSCGNPVVHKGLRRMGLVVSGDYDLSFYFKDFLYGPALNIVREADPDKALSIGLDFIYN